MGFKNNIRHMVAVVGNTLLKTFRKFFVTLQVSSGGMESISCWIPSFKSSSDQGRCLKTFSFKYPQSKKVTWAFRPSVKRVWNASLSQNGCSRNTLQQQSPDVHRSNPLWVLKTVEANQPHDTTPPLYLYCSPNSASSKCERSLCPILYI